MYTLLLNFALLSLGSAPQDPAAQVITCTGVAHPAQVAALSAPRGLELNMCLAPGTSVDQGQLIASFDDRAQLLARLQAEIQLRREQNAVRQREMRYRRESELLELLRNQFDRLRAVQSEGRGRFSDAHEAELRVHEKESQVLDLEIAVEAARFSVAAAEAALEAAEVNLRATQIFAPFGGTIAAVDLRIGERAPETPIIQLINSSALLLECHVPLVSLAAIKRSSAARVYPQATATKDASKSIEARLVRVGSTVDHATQTIAIWLDLGEVSADVLPGQSCRAEFSSR